MNYLIIVFCLYLISSCDNLSNKNAFEEEVQFHRGKSLVQDIPKGLLSPYEMELKKNSDPAIGLESLNNGFEKFQIRIWETFQNNTGRTIIIKNVNDQWNAALYRFDFLPTGGFTLDSISPKKGVIGQPASGWKNFIDHLIGMKILTIPNFSTLPNYDAATDETSVRIEIAMPNYYKTYQYLDPESRGSRFKEAAIVADFLAYLKKEFQIK